VDAVVVDRETVADAQNVRDRDGTQPEPVVYREDAILEVVRVIGVGISLRSLDLGDLASVAVLLGELLARRRLISN